MKAVVVTLKNGVHLQLLHEDLESALELYEKLTEISQDNMLTPIVDHISIRGTDISLVEIVDYVGGGENNYEATNNQN